MPSTVVDTADLGDSSICIELRPNRPSREIGLMPSRVDDLADLGESSISIEISRGLFWVGSVRDPVWELDLGL